MHNLTKETFSKFLFAGQAIFTVVSYKSQEHMTFSVKKKKDSYFVYVAKGYLDWLYLGAVNKDKNDLVFTKGSKASPDAISVKTARFILHNKENDKLFEQAEIKHNGKCGRCGRTLTDPALIEIGLGSECRKK